MRDLVTAPGAVTALQGHFTVCLLITMNDNLLIRDVNLPLFGGSLLFFFFFFCLPLFGK